MIYFEGILAGYSAAVGESEVWTYMFRSDSHRDLAQDVARNRYCPRIGARHPTIRYLFLKAGGLTITQGSGKEWNKWTVQVKYSKLDPEEEEPEEESPTKEPTAIEQPDWKPKISVQFEEYSAPLNGKFTPSSGSYGEQEAVTSASFAPVVNSALEPYETPPEIIRVNTIVDVRINLPIGDAVWKEIPAINNTINSDSFEFKRGKYVQRFVPKSIRLKCSIGPEIEYKDKRGKKKSYSELNCQFVENRESWRVFVLDYGSYYLSQAGKSINLRTSDNDWELTSGTTKIPFTDVENNAKFGLLAGDGQQATTSFFNEYSGYTEKPHAKFFKSVTFKRKRR